MTDGKRLPVVPGEVRSATTPEEPSLNVVGGKADALLRDPVESTRVVAAALLVDKRDDSSSRASAPLDLAIVVVDLMLLIRCMVTRCEHHRVQFHVWRSWSGERSGDCRSFTYKILIR